MSKFYRVKAVFEYPGTQKALMEGMFIPKKDESTPAKIKEQCADFLRKQVRWGDHDHDPSKLKITVSYTTIDCDFVVCEDKE